MTAPYFPTPEEIHEAYVRHFGSPDLKAAYKREVVRRQEAQSVVDLLKKEVLDLRARADEAWRLFRNGALPEG